jgi:hypothetical protein
MTTDYYAYCKTTKKRAKETIKEQDTPQDKERLKITPLIQENQDKEQHRRATTSHRKAIPKEQQIGHDVSTGQKRFPEHNGRLRRGLLC